jgi:colicin import membrane protein
MKAALRAWGASESDLFQQGFAKQSDDREVIAAAMAQPGVVLRRPVGSNKRFQEHAVLPTAESLTEYSRRSELPRKKTRSPKLKKTDEKAERKAAAAFEKEERRRDLQHQKEEAAAAKARGRRLAEIEKAKSALETARREHDVRAALIEKDREAVELRAQTRKHAGRKRKEGLKRLTSILARLSHQLLTRRGAISGRVFFCHPGLRKE